MDAPAYHGIVGFVVLGCCCLREQNAEAFERSSLVDALSYYGDGVMAVVYQRDMMSTKTSERQRLSLTDRR